MKSLLPGKPRYIDPLTDFGFKHLFGSEPNKEILIGFLNTLFKGKKLIKDLNYNPTERLGDNESNKKVHFDLMCTGENGEQFIVEMQRGLQQFFKERSVYYTSRLISDQLPKGQESWDYGLKEVYFIALLEFELPELPKGEYLHDICLMNKSTHEVFYNKLQFKFIELIKFVKEDGELRTDLDKWFYLLRNMSKLDKIPTFMDKRIFQKVFKIAEISKLGKEERLMYDSSLKAKWDYENTLAYAVKEAEKKAKLEEAIAIASEMKKEGIPAAQIVKFTKLSKEEIEKL